MKSRFIILAVLFSLLLSACTISLASDITPPPNYQSPTPGPTMSPLFPQSPPDLAAGAVIFAEKCAPCHGDTGQGDGPMASKLQKPPAAIGKPEIARAAAPANWYTIVTEGNINSFMPPFKDGLSDQQRWDVVAYSISLGGSTALEAQKGKSVYEAQCLQCHGPSGNAIPNVDLSDQALLAKINQNDIANFVNKGVGTMPGFGGLIPDADVYAVAAYVRGFTVSVPRAAAAATATPVPATAALEPSATPQTTSDATAGPTGTPDGTPLAQATSAPAATSTPAITSTPTQAVGTITGQVTNGSGASLPDTLKAVLHIFEHDTATQKFSEISTQEAPLSPKGTYQFENIPLLSNRAFYVSVNYSNTNYESDPAFPEAGKTAYDLPVTLFDTITDASGLVADQVHLILDYTKGNVVQIVEYYIITNPGKQTIVATEKGGPVVSVALPKGYSNLQFEQGGIGDRYITTADGFADTTSVTPGMKQYQIVFAFELPLPKPGLLGGQKLQFSHPIPVKANSVSILVPQGIKVEGANITDGGPQDMGNGTKFQIFNAGAFKPGQILDVTSTGSPSGTVALAPGSNTTQNIVIGIGAFGLVLIIAGGWLFWRERKRAGDEDLDDDDDDEDGEDGDEASTQDEIMDAILALDDQFKSGNISEQAYKERRAELKAKLKNLL